MKLLTATALFLLATPTAFAADLAPQPVEPAAPVELPFSWTGFYVGAHAGAVFSDAKLSSPVTGVRQGFDSTGFIGGAHLGYNEQFDNNIVVGLEGDIDYSSLSKSQYLGDGAYGKFKNDWQGSVRARLGYAFDRFLPYLTAGVAFGDQKFSVYDPGTGLGASSNKTAVGWTAGGGVEYAWDDHWSVRGEVRYTDFGKKNIDFAGTRLKGRFNDTTTTLGISYKF
ncbi:outer membrane protein [Labrys monachus]|uniref:Outer membrane immunogenic protein n=1 Tax=Labrys monachus TaxID=217067 RepID=A0ABU0FII7_9HYPH|nr:outer membrane protein [Labrys monachus]MDQ0394291.1 outer membrane immunogenic protein [Labrys monachus]